MKWSHVSNYKLRAHTKRISNDNLDTWDSYVCCPLSNTSRSQCDTKGRATEQVSRPVLCAPLTCYLVPKFWGGRPVHLIILHMIFQGIYVCKFWIIAYFVLTFKSSTYAGMALGAYYYTSKIAYCYAFWISLILGYFINSGSSNSCLDGKLSNCFCTVLFLLCFQCFIRTS